MNSNDSIVILDAKRTPTANFLSHFKDTPAPLLGAAAIEGTLKSAKIDPEQVDEVLMGCVLPAGQGQAPARQAALAANIPFQTPCTTINKMCGSGMKTVMLAHDALKVRNGDIIVAGGMENMSMTPYLLPKARSGYRIGHAKVLDHMMLDGLEDAYQQECSMGYFAEQTAEAYSFSRSAMDDFAIASVQRAQQAQSNGSFVDEIIPVTIKTPKGEMTIEQDEGPQTANVEKIPKLKPAFVKDGSVTAANSSSISDGAAALVLARESTACELGLKPIARIVGHYTFAHEPAWFTTAPIGAIEGLLERVGWHEEDVDLFEINEAFAVVTMVTMQELGIDHAKVNVNGGACVLGHPIGASGARVLVTLIHALRERKLKRGVAALCIGGGEATAVAVEVL